MPSTRTALRTQNCEHAMVRWRRRVGHYTEQLHSNESSLISVSRPACACQGQSLRPGITPGARRWRGASRGRLQRVGVRLRRSSTRTASRRRPSGGSCTSSPASMQTFYRQIISRGSRRSRLHASHLAQCPKDDGTEPNQTGVNSDLPCNAAPNTSREPGY